MQDLIRYQMAFKEAMDIHQKIKSLSAELTGLGHPLSTAQFAALAGGFPEIYELIHHHIERCKRDVATSVV